MIYDGRPVTKFYPSQYAQNFPESYFCGLLRCYFIISHFNGGSFSIPLYSFRIFRNKFKTDCPETHRVVNRLQVLNPSDMSRRSIVQSGCAGIAVSAPFLNSLPASAKRTPKPPNQPAVIHPWQTSTAPFISIYNHV